MGISWSVELKLLGHRKLAVTDRAPHLSRIPFFFGAALSCRLLGFDLHQYVVGASGAAKCEIGVAVLSGERLHVDAEPTSLSLHDPLPISQFDAPTPALSRRRGAKRRGDRKRAKPPAVGSSAWLSIDVRYS